MEHLDWLSADTPPESSPPRKQHKKPAEAITTNIELVERPVVRNHSFESPEDPDPAKRLAFYKHNCHFFIFTAAGKPVFTRYGDPYNVTSLCASYSAIIPKLQSTYSYATAGIDSENLLRYIKTKNMLIAFMFKKNIIYLCISKGDKQFSSIYRQLQYLHIQVLFLSQNSLYR